MDLNFEQPETGTDLTLAVNAVQPVRGMRFPAKFPWCLIFSYMTAPNAFGNREARFVRMPFYTYDSAKAELDRLVRETPTGQPIKI